LHVTDTLVHSLAFSVLTEVLSGVANDSETYTNHMDNADDTAVYRKS